MYVKIIKDIESLVLYKNEWEGILKDNDNPFLEFEWIYNWWIFLSRGYELFIIVVFDEYDNILGFAPFMKLNRKIYSEIYFIGYPESNYGDLIFSIKFREEGIRFLIDYLYSLNERLVFRLHGFIEDDSNFKIIKSYLNERGVKLFTKSVNSYFIKTNRGGFGEYYKNRKKHNAIRQIIKNEEALERLGSLQYGRLDDSRIDEIFKLHLKRWKRKNDKSNFANGMVREFFKHMALKESMEFKTHVTSLYLNEKLIAFGYGFECKGRCLLYRTAFDDDFKSFGIGKIILKDIIEECFKKGLDILDLSIGYEKYKTDFTDSFTRVSKIIFSSKGFISNIIFQIYCIKGKLIRFLKRSKRIVNFKRNIMSNLRYIFSRESFSHKFLRVKKLIRRKGIFKAITELILRLINTFYFSRNYIIFEKELYNKKSEIPKGFELKTAGVYDVELLSDIMDIEPSCIIDRFKKGNKCFKLYYENEIVSFVWVSLSRISIEDKIYEIPLNESFFIYDNFMVLPFNKELYYKALPFIIRDFCDFKLKSCLIWLDKRDKGLIGYKKKYSIKNIKLFKWSRHLIKREGEDWG